MDVGLGATSLRGPTRDDGGLLLVCYSEAKVVQLKSKVKTNRLVRMFCSTLLCLHRAPSSAFTAYGIGGLKQHKFVV